jgi:FAD/FMN-containing dehydrogenase
VSARRTSGPSGRYATVGGALSQNSLFYGSAQYGTVADFVVGLEVVVADGSTLHTGSWGRRGSAPFFRYNGPDLPGVFSATRVP